jgi:hypothetical protein
MPPAGIERAPAQRKGVYVEGRVVSAPAYGEPLLTDVRASESYESGNIAEEMVCVNGNDSRLAY